MMRSTMEAAAEPLTEEQYEKMLLSKIPQPNLQFSGEERFGKYLDLLQFHNRFLNSKFGHSAIDYTTFLDNFPALILPNKFSSVTVTNPVSNKISSVIVTNALPIKFSSVIVTNTEYRDYISDLLEYLVSFMERTRPLMFLDRIFSNIKPDNHFFEKYEKLPKAKKRRRVEETTTMIAKVEKLCEILKETIERTRQHVKNKQGMTYNELIEDRRETDEEDYGFESDDEIKEELLYNNNNPLKVPLGWDGKPIPYWLYKLHGLDKEYKCQICGGHSYWGRRAFERHFKEARHQQGLAKCLGIGSKKHGKSFYEVTVIEDAKRLWEEIQMRLKEKVWNPEIDEEFEDDEGNVYNKVIYTDLKNQGLI